MSFRTGAKWAAIVCILFCGLSLAQAPSGKPAAEERKSLRLTLHENETLENETVYLSGQAFVKCQFKACTIVVRESTYHLEGCSFDRCNWHLDMLVMWGDTTDNIKELRALLDLIDKAER